MQYWSCRCWLIPVRCLSSPLWWLCGVDGYLQESKLAVEQAWLLRTETFSASSRVITPLTRISTHTAATWDGGGGWKSRQKASGSPAMQSDCHQLSLPVLTLGGTLLTALMKATCSPSWHRAGCRPSARCTFRLCKPTVALAVAAADLRWSQWSVILPESLKQQWQRLVVVKWTFVLMNSSSCGCSCQLHEASKLLALCYLIQLNISEWPFPAHSTPVIILFDQHPNRPHLSGGWKILFLDKNSELI